MEEVKDLKTVDWKVTNQRFVAFLDILGFRDLVMRSSHAEIYELLSEFSKRRVALNTIDKNQLLPLTHKNAGIYTVSFSDSIVIFSKDNSLASFDLFSLATGWLFTRAINMKIPIKGAIATGEISVDQTNQVFFGQPIIDAFLLEEEVNYFGIVAHNSIDSYLSNVPNDIRYKANYKEILTPLKCGIITHLNFNWFEDYIKLKKITNSKENLILMVKEFNKKISGSPRRYVDNTLKVIDEFYPMS